jgi:MFS family permease
LNNASGILAWSPEFRINAVFVRRDGAGKEPPISTFADTHTTKPQGNPRPAPVTRVVAAIMGNALEFYDFTVYAAFAAMLGRAFFPASNPNVSLLLSVATFGVGFVARPLGGILIGAYADRFGRKPAMTLTIWLMALGSGMIGLLPTYEQIGVLAPILLVLARLIQGFSAGGEMGPATTYLLESAPPGRQCFFGSWQLASQNIGSIISGLVGVILALVMSEQATNGWGWRVPFLLGILIAPIGFYIRRNLDETLDAEEAHGSMGAVLKDIVGRHWRKIGLCILVISGATVTQYFFIYTTTFAITSLGYSQRIAMTANLTGGVVGTIFSVFGGVLADRFGIKAIALIPRIVVTALLYPALHLVVSSGSPAIFIAVVGCLMTLHAMSSAAGIILIPKIFPAAIRTSGLSIAYALGVTIFGGTAQIVFTWIIGATGDKQSWIYYVIALSILSILGTLAIRVPAEWSMRGGRSIGKTAPGALAGASG